jgi:hypothetical protein
MLLGCRIANAAFYVLGVCTAVVVRLCESRQPALSSQQQLANSRQWHAAAFFRKRLQIND